MEIQKEQLKEIKNQIISEMKKNKKWGNFFPVNMSSFGYNETAAIEQFPLTKKEALAQGFKWEDIERGTYKKETIDWRTFPNSINDLPRNFDVSKEIFVCVECNKNYRVIKDELSFYQKMSIPIPRECPECRHRKRFKNRGPNNLWHRRCQCAGIESDNKIYQNTVNHPHHNKNHCSNEFETSYSPERKEIVYCESCYQKEIY